MAFESREANLIVLEQCRESCERPARSHPTAVLACFDPVRYVGGYRSGRYETLRVEVGKL